jgi:hypothetical protein
VRRAHVSFCSAPPRKFVGAAPPLGRYAWISAVRWRTRCRTVSGRCRMAVVGRGESVKQPARDDCELRRSESVIDPESVTASRSRVRCLMATCGSRPRASSDCPQFGTPAKLRQAVTALWPRNNRYSTDSVQRRVIHTRLVSPARDPVASRSMTASHESPSQHFETQGTETEDC